MLFDLRSRGRRRAVRVIYAGLAVLMFGGLVLFGVGAGNGLGGLLNAFTNQGSSGAQNQAITQALKSARKEVAENPTSAAAQGNLVQALWIAAGEGSNYNSTTGAYTASGKQYLSEATQAWEKYQTMTSTPSIGIATIAGRSYALTGDYAGAAGAWEGVTLTEPTSAVAYFCFAASSYAAKQTRKGDLAAAQTVKLAPELQRLSIKEELKSARTSPSVAKELVSAQCS